MTAIHVSFDTVTKFTPRVPKWFCTNEDCTIPRICVVPDIRSALNAIPQCGQVMEYMRNLNLPVIIHVYYLYGGKQMDNKEVQKYVPDAGYTKEFWVTSVPDRVNRIDYEVTDFDVQKTKNAFGEEVWDVSNVQLSRCKYQSNIENFIRAFAQTTKKEPLRKLFTEYSYRTVMSNMGEEFALMSKVHQKEEERYLWKQSETD